MDRVVGTLPSVELGREEALKRMCAKLMRFEPASKLDAEIRPRRSRRSENQNRYLYGVCYREILKHMPEGWENDDLHDHFLGEHFGTETITGPLGTLIKPIRRSSRLNKQEFADYIAFVQREAAKLGIVIPDPQL